MKRHRHVLEAQQFGRAELEELFETTRVMKAELCRKGGQRHRILAGLRTELPTKHVTCMFWEPSTRTRMSFTLAARHLGMTVDGSDNAGEFSSSVKGESLEDMMQVLMRYRPDFVVIRHKDEGSAARAAKVADSLWNNHPVCVINAGDGQGQHPTQSLLDLFTIVERFGFKNLKKLKIVIGGDLLFGRTTHSLAYLLGKFPGVRLVFVSPDELRMKPGVKEYLTRHGVSFEETGDFQSAVKEASVVYWTRVQKERFVGADGLATYERIKDNYIITPREMEMLEDYTMLLHPLPRINEISTDVDRDPRDWKFRQAENGLPVRMALYMSFLPNGD